jgi:hypothetical protein
LLGTKGYVVVVLLFWDIRDHLTCGPSEAKPPTETTPFPFLNCLDIMLASGLLRGSFGGVLLRSTLRDSVQRSKTPLHPPAPRVKHSGFALQVRSGKSLPPCAPCTLLHSATCGPSPSLDTLLYWFIASRPRFMEEHDSLVADPVLCEELDSLPLTLTWQRSCSVPPSPGDGATKLYHTVYVGT